MRYSLTCGVFDCLHEGHINLLKQMKSRADKVIVLLHDSKSTFENKGRFPIQCYQQRKKNLKSTGLVDTVIGTGFADPSRILDIILSAKSKPTTYMRGDDWEDFPGRKIIEKWGIPIEFVPYTQGISTTMRREKEIKHGTKGKHYHSGY